MKILGSHHIKTEKAGKQVAFFASVRIVFKYDRICWQGTCCNWLVPVEEWATDIEEEYGGCYECMPH